MDHPDREPRRITVERLLWAALVGLTALVVTIGGSWVASMERRITLAEGKTIALEKDAAVFTRDIAEMKGDVKAILNLLRAAR